MPELLAPAGSLEHVLTAIDAGADAVYLGGKAFNARKFAHNLSDEELAEAVRIAHVFAVRIYVTVNIVMADSELAAVAEYVRRLDQLGVDGIIVQDLAVAALARRIAPSLPLHGSTQMTVADIGGVRFLERLGFSQVVLARELSLEEIRAICAQASVPVEVFIHGASCMSYSGQCLMSSFIGGRSGNRGACAQPCRLPYRLLRDGKAVQKNESCLLSLKDLNTLPYIQQLIDAGVSSFKIEGRMKGTGYVRDIVQAYRRVMDSCRRSPKERQTALRQAAELTAESFNRTYQHDFLAGTIGRQTITEQTGGNCGIRIGTVTSCQGKKLQALLDEALAPGDMIKIVTPAGQEYIDEIQQAIGSFSHKSAYTLELRRSDAEPGTVYRLSRREDRANRHGGLQRRLPIYGHLDCTENGVLRLTVWDETGHTACAESDYTPPIAQKRPATAAWVRDQLNRLGDTPFSLASVTVWDESHMIPASVLNQLRRQAVHMLTDTILCEYVRPAAGHAARETDCMPAGQSIRRPLQIAVRCDTLDAVCAAARGGAKRIIFGGESYSHQPFTEDVWRQAVQAGHDLGAEVWAATPRIITQHSRKAAQKELAAALQCGIDGVYAGAMSVYTMLCDVAADLPVWADWTLNIFNAAAAGEYVRLGCRGITLSPELTLRQIRPISRDIAVPVELVVHGRMEMMVTEYCSIAALAGTGEKTGCPQPCRRHTFSLQDRRDEQFPVVTDQYCRNHVLNSKDLNMIPYFSDLSRSGISWIRVEGRGRSAAWIYDSTRQYVRLADGTETMLFTKEDRTVTRGHFFRGIL